MPLAKAPIQRTWRMQGAVTSVALVAGLTGCPTGSDVTDSIGKDYFYGTWVTTESDAANTEVSAASLNIDTLKAAANGFHHYYEGTGAGSDGEGTYHVVMWNFNGKSENISDGGIFRQRILSYRDKDLTQLYRDNLAYGAYDIKGNSSYNKGKLFLQYQFVILGRDAVGRSGSNDTFTATEIEALNELYEKFWLEYEENGKPKKNTGWTEKEILGFAASGAKYTKGIETDFTKYKDGEEEKDITDDLIKEWLKFEDTGFLGKITPAYEGANSTIGYYAKNGVWIYLKNVDGKGTLKSSDTEYFRFVLADESASGYTRMKASALSLKNDDTEVIGRVYDGWLEQNDTNKAAYEGNGSYSSKYGYPVQKKPTWTGALTRYMGRYSTYKNEYLYNTGDKAKTNAEQFKDIESSDSADNYTEPEGEVK